MKEHDYLSAFLITEGQYSTEKHLHFLSKDSFAAQLTEQDNPQDDDLTILGHEELRKLLLATFPYQHPDTEEPYDFPELHPTELNPETFQYEPLFSQAVLFTGESGCGKRAVSEAYVQEIFRMVNEQAAPTFTPVGDIFAYYRLNLTAENVYRKSERIEYLSRFFQALYQLADTEWAQERLLLISFGDITEILRHNSSARYFSEQIRLLLSRTENNFYLIARYEGSASQLKESIKEPFFVYELLPPDQKTRKLFFDRLNRKYTKCSMHYTAGRMAELTDGFTFAMLEKIRKMYLMVVKSEILEAGFSYPDYVENQEMAIDRLITIPDNMMDQLIDNVLRSHFQPAASYSAAMVHPIYSVQTGKTEAELSETIPARREKKNKDESLEQQAKNVVAGMTSVKEMDRLFENLAACV